MHAAVPPSPSGRPREAAAVESGWSFPLSGGFGVRGRRGSGLPAARRPAGLVRSLSGRTL